MSRTPRSGVGEQPSAPLPLGCGGILLHAPTCVAAPKNFSTQKLPYLRPVVEGGVGREHPTAPTPPVHAEERPYRRDRTSSLRAVGDNRPMKILHISQPTTEGTAQVVLGLVNGGVLAGHDVAVACPRSGMLANCVQEAGGSWHPLELIRRPGAGDAAAWRRVRLLAKDYDVVHLHSSKAGALGRVAARTMRRRPGMVFSPHGWSWLSSRRLRRVYVWIERVLAPLADFTIAVGDDELREGQAVLGESSRLRLIRNGVDTEVFTPNQGNLRSGNEIVCIGRLAVQKGQDRLLRALVETRSSDTRVTFVGTGPEEARLRELSAQLGLASRVSFVGFDAPLEHLRRATLVVLPSRWEGLPLALLEAMACGAPVVMTNCGGASALRDCGIVVSNDEASVVQELASAIDQLMESPKLRGELGTLARARAVEAYDERKCVRSYHELYETAARQTARDPNQIVGR